MIRRLFTAPRVIVLVATIGVAQLSLAHPHRLARDRRSRGPLPACRSAACTTIGEHPDHRAAAVHPDRRPARRARPRLAPQPHHVRQDREGVGREPRPGPPRPASARSPCPPRCGRSPVGWRRSRSRSWPARPDRRRTSTTSARAPWSARSRPRSSPAWCRSHAPSSPGSPSGSSQAVVGFNFLDQPGLIDFLLFLAVLVAVYFQSRQGRGETQTFSFAPRRNRSPSGCGRSGGSARSTASAWRSS